MRYALLTPKEAEPEQKDHVYVGKKSGTRWDTRYPSPNRCYTCKGPHWRADCPLEAEKKDQTESRSFPRGKPPARYYISKHGKVYDTTRRPTSECHRCGKLHFWFSCPRGGDVAFIYKGASFVDHADERIANQISARIRRGTDTETGDSDASSLSSAGDQLPQKRNRAVRIAKPQAEPAPSTPRRPPQTSSNPPPPSGYTWHPYGMPGFAPPPHQQQQQPFWPGYYHYGFPPYSAQPLPPSETSGAPQPHLHPPAASTPHLLLQRSPKPSLTLLSAPNNLLSHPTCSSTSPTPLGTSARQCRFLLAGRMQHPDERWLQLALQKLQQASVSTYASALRAIYRFITLSPPHSLSTSNKLSQSTPPWYSQGESGPQFLPYPGHEHSG